MAKKNRNYWRDRAEEHKKIVDKDTEQVIRETREAYERSLHHIDGEIARWYQRFADAEEITVEEARQQMTAGELNRYRMTLEEYIARGEQLDLDSSWATALEKASALHHIDRYDALRTIIRAEIEELKAKTRGTSWMDMIAEDAYNHMIYALSREAGLAIGFNQPAIDRLKMLIKSPWAPDGIDFARRVDMNMDKLAAEITKKLQQAFVTGQPYRELAADIEKTVGLKQYEAERIIRTESTQISSHAEQAAYNTAGIEQYEILVTLDDRTCELCGLMDKTVEDVEKMEPGVNAPPFHPNCRCTTVGHYDDGIDETRIARDEDGNPVHVNGDMTWEEWKAVYGRDEALEEYAGGIMMADYLIKTGNLTGGSNLANERRSIYEALRKSPEKVREAAKSLTIVVADREASGYDSSKGVMYIAKGATTEDVYHELGHMVEHKLADRNAIDALKRSRFKNASPWDVHNRVYNKTAGGKQKIFILDDPTLVDEYQGRLYVNSRTEAFDQNGNLRVDKMREFVSVPYQLYMKNPAELKRKDPQLFKIIERAVR